MNYLIGLIALSLPLYLVRFAIFGIPTTLLEVLIYLVLIIALIWFPKRQSLSLKFWLPVGLLLLAAAVSTMISPEKMAALGQFKAFFVDPIIVVWLILSYLKKEDFPIILNGLIGSALIVSGYSLWQKITGQLTIDGRVVGIFGYSPNYVALFLTPIVGLITAYTLELLLKKVDLAKKNWQIWLNGLAIILGLIAIYLSASRGAFLALVAGAFFYLIMILWGRIKKSNFIKIGLVFLILVAVLGSWFVFKPNFSLSPEEGGRITSSDNIRWQIWQTSVELGQKNPILGVGLGNYQSAFDQLTKDRVNFSAYITPLALSSHNIFLMFWLSTGLLGLMAFVWILINFFSRGLFPGAEYPVACCGDESPLETNSSGRNTPSALPRGSLSLPNNPAVTALMVAMAILVLQGLVDTPYFKNDLSLYFWFNISLIYLFKA